MDAQSIDTLKNYLPKGAIPHGEYSVSLKRVKRVVYMVLKGPTDYRIAIEAIPDYVLSRAHRTLRGYRMASFKWTRAFPIKSYVASEVNIADGKGGHFRDEVPWWYGIGPACATSTCSQWMQSKIVAYCHPGCYHWAKSVGFVPYLPRDLGGLGFPPRRKRECRFYGLPRLY